MCNVEVVARGFGSLVRVWLPLAPLAAAHKAYRVSWQWGLDLRCHPLWRGLLLLGLQLPGLQWQWLGQECLRRQRLGWWWLWLQWLLLRQLYLLLSLQLLVVRLLLLVLLLEMLGLLLGLLLLLRRRSICHEGRLLPIRGR
jgi:hypothetical protein